MNRLNIINFINPSWYKQINQFLDENPAYNKLLPIVALDEFPTGFNKNPYESDEDAPLNIFETIIYGLAHANVDIEYGKLQYLKLIHFFRNNDIYTNNMTFPDDIQKDKISIYQDLINTILNNNFSLHLFTYDHIHVIQNIAGMTESTITLLHLLYDENTSDKCIPYHDKQFNRGMQMFYNLEHTDVSSLKEITNTWTNKKVGLMFIVQYAHYSEYV
jgi:hypothetical protein